MAIERSMLLDNLCDKQRALIDWSSDAGWISVRVQGKMRYAIAGGREDWLTSVACANQDMVDALYEALIEQKRAPLDPYAAQEDVKRVENWLRSIEEMEQENG